MENILQKYLELIRDFQEKLKSEYHITENPWVHAGKRVPNSGLIGDYSYQYHGSGVTINKSGIICEYDVAPLSEYEIKFSLWKFNAFIKSHPEFKSLNYDDKYVKGELDSLVIRGVLELLNIDGRVFQIYQVNLA
ncbi:MAG TPA: hypothetical protein VF676_07655 [Flavobacterium sp.]|jgi:hypothetical protein